MMRDNSEELKIYTFFFLPKHILFSVNNVEKHRKREREKFNHYKSLIIWLIVNMSLSHKLVDSNQTLI